MDNVRLKIQVDFGVADVIVPGPRMIQYPVLLGGDKIQLLAYPVESAIAEIPVACVSRPAAIRSRSSAAPSMAEHCFRMAWPAAVTEKPSGVRLRSFTPSRRSSAEIRRPTVT